MKTIKRNRYYCDYCKKSSGGSYAMKLHEAHCTNNPNRKCRMCHDPVENPAGHSVKTIEELRKLAGECPACMLSVFRQSHIDAFGFDFKAEAERWFEAIREQDQRDAELATYQ